jgi:hypothetical protein
MFDWTEGARVIHCLDERVRKRGRSRENSSDMGGPLEYVQSRSLKPSESHSSRVYTDITTPVSSFRLDERRARPIISP